MNREEFAALVSNLEHAAEASQTAQEALQTALLRQKAATAVTLPTLDPDAAHAAMVRADEVRARATEFLKAEAWRTACERTLAEAVEALEREERLAPQTPALLGVVGVVADQLESLALLAAPKKPTRKRRTTKRTATRKNTRTRATKR